MLQIKTVFFSRISDMDSSVNEFLSTIESECFKDIRIEDGYAVIMYESKESWKGRMCADCQYWDDGNSSDSVSGICHECGGRRRFNCKACDRFKDVRE